MPTLSPAELVDLVRSVFPRFETDKTLAILVDVPRDTEMDGHPAWKERRRLAHEWHALLDARKGEIPLAEVKLIAYPDVGSNNADLPWGRLPPRWADAGVSPPNWSGRGNGSDSIRFSPRPSFSWPRPSSRPRRRSRWRPGASASARPRCPASPHR